MVVWSARVGPRFDGTYVAEVVAGAAGVGGGWRRMVSGGVTGSVGRIWLHFSVRGRGFGGFDVAGSVGRIWLPLMVSAGAGAVRKSALRFPGRSQVPAVEDGGRTVSRIDAHVPVYPRREPRCEGSRGHRCRHSRRVRWLGRGRGGVRWTAFEPRGRGHSPTVLENERK